MFLFSKWDICGLLIANVLSDLFLINYNFCIIFCCKKQIINDSYINDESSFHFEINNFIRKCFISRNSMVATFISVSIGNFIKNNILKNSLIGIKIFFICFVGLINITLVYIFENKDFVIDLNLIKSY